MPLNAIFHNKAAILLAGFVAIFSIQVNAQVGSVPDTAGERMIDIGFHKLFISEKGNRDAPFTIVFESGAGGGARDWTKVIATLPPDYHTLAYDRAGTGKSEPGPLPRTMEQEVFELHKLLEKAKIKGPVILVGQSIGGLLVRMYTERYGKNIKGLVLVDPTHESSMLGSIRYGGWTRLREKATGKPIPKPQLENKVSNQYDSTADYMAEEFQQMYAASLKNKQQLKNRPTIIIGAGIRKQPPGTPDDQWKQLRAERDTQIEELTSLSGNSKFILDPKSGHYVQNDNPEIVAQSIQQVVNAISTKSRLE
jgi:pimeloyl-ACP methyl ester carboxylesterase